MLPTAEELVGHALARSNELESSVNAVSAKHDAAALLVNALQSQLTQLTQCAHAHHAHACT